MIDLRLGDCLDVMGSLEAGSVDLILADLPYGTTACKWDVIIPFEPLWAHYRRLLKPRGAVVLTASQPFTSMLVMSNPKWFKYCLVWIKGGVTGFLDAKFRPLKAHEDIVVFSPAGCSNGSNPPMTYHPQRTTGPPNHSRGDCTGKRHESGIHHSGFRMLPSDTSGLKYPKSTLSFVKHPARERQHKSEKPVALMEYLIRTYSNEGDTVLDNAMGSGTTGVACVNTGRRFIGIEKNPGYFAIAERRLDSAHAVA